MAKEETPWRIKGGAVDEESVYLAPIWGPLQGDPRGRQWVIGEVVSGESRQKHPEDDGDEETEILVFRSLTAITDAADVDQLRAMARRVWGTRPGQQSWSADELAARRDGE